MSGKIAAQKMWSEREREGRKSLPATHFAKRKKEEEERSNAVNERHVQLESGAETSKLSIRELYQF